MGQIGQIGLPSSTDYSDRAITIRIRQMSQLRKLCLSLAKAKPAAEKTAPQEKAQER